MSRSATKALILMSSLISLAVYLLLHRDHLILIARWLRGGQ